MLGRGSCAAGAAHPRGFLETTSARGGGWLNETRVAGWGTPDPDLCCSWRLEPDQKQARARRREDRQKELARLGRVVVVDRPLDFHPGEGHAGRAIAHGQRVGPVGRPRAEQPGGIGPDRLARQQMRVDFVNRWIDVSIKLPKPAKQPRRGFRINRDRFIPAAGGDVIQIRNVPLVPFARPRPHRPCLKPQLIPARHRSDEPVKGDLQRLVGAGDHAHRFLLAQLRIGIADGNRRLAGADIRLAARAQHGKRSASGRVLKTLNLILPVKLR